MVEWNLTVSENTANVVRTHLDQYESDLNTFVEEAIQQRIFWETVEQIHQRNAGADPNEIERLVDEAVDWARAHRS